MGGVGILIRKLTGKKLFSRLRFTGYKVLHKVYRPFSEDEFKHLLTQRLGVRPGDTLFIHSSSYKLHITFSPNQVINILLDLVGPEGTLAFPCWHFSKRAEDYLEDEASIFNVRRSPSVMGLIPELARRHKNAHRSLHPTSSVVAIGRNAFDLIKDHHLSDYPCGESSPFSKIMHYNGKILGLGETAYDSLSFVHCVEDHLKDKFPVKTRTNKIFDGKVMDETGKLMIVKTRAAHKNIQHRNIKGFFKKHITPEECLSFQKRSTHFFVADSVKLFSKMKNLALQGKTIYGF